MTSANNCCPNCDTNTLQACILCKAPICGNCFELYEHHAICKTCHTKVLEELAQEIATQKDIPMGILGGLAGALLGAILWALVVIITHFEVGYVAIGVGFLAGQGVAILVGRRKAFSLQVISAIFATLGCILGNLFISAYQEMHYDTTNEYANNYLNIQLWINCFDEFKRNFGFFSVLWIVFAVFVSWRISAPSKNDNHT